MICERPRSWIRAPTRAQEELGDVNFQLHRYGNAVESYEAYIRLDDHSARCSTSWRWRRAARGDLTRAVAALQDAVRLNPSFREAHYVLGLCLKERGQLRDARRRVRTGAIAIAPAFIPAREELADLHRLQGRTARGNRSARSARCARSITAGAPDCGRPGVSRAPGIRELAVTTLGRAAETVPRLPGRLCGAWPGLARSAEERGDNASAAERRSRRSSRWPASRRRPARCSGSTAGRWR